MGKNSKLKKFWGLEAQHRFLDRFTQLVENGFSVAGALGVMQTMFKPQALQFMCSQCEAGLPFATGLEESGFEKRIVYMVRCNEENGSLLLGLQKAREFSVYYLKNRRELTQKLRYPLFLLGLMAFVLSAAYVFFIPHLEGFYDSFNLEGDPFAIRVMFVVMGAILSLAPLFGGIIFYFLNSKKERLFPFRLKFAQQLFSYYFASQWQMLLACGLPLKESLETILQFETVPLVRHAIIKVKAQLETGDALESVLGNSCYFTPYFKTVMCHALQIGCVPKELGLYTQMELKRLSGMLGQAFKVLQTGLLVAIGSMIALLYLSILQPVFDLVHIL
ncbi:MAG: type II secretion system F family protein [Turicibacter sp.]|nr:type II secretion system F family protein [Turicibacter sp.]